MKIERRLQQVEAKLETIATTSPRVVDRAPEPTAEAWQAGDYAPVTFITGVGAVRPGDRVRVGGRTISGAEFIERIG